MCEAAERVLSLCQFMVFSVAAVRAATDCVMYTRT